MRLGVHGKPASAPKAQCAGTLLFDRFEAVAELGHGSFGRVWQCYDRDEHQLVALKELRRYEADALLAFKHEFRALADVHHPNLVRLGELFEGADGRWGFTMELVPGFDFLTWVRAGSPAPGFDEARLRAGLEQLLTGIDALHRKGMLHRDIKPENVRVTPQGRVVLLDFGLVANLLPGQDALDDCIAGTPAYMAPEQVQQRAGTAADLYAVGVLLYEVLTGGLPHTGSGMIIVLNKAKTVPEPPRLRNQAVAPWLDDLCMRLLETNPDARATARDVLTALGASPSAACAEDPPRSADEPELFIGRESELRELKAQWQESRTNGLRIVLLEGESGVGKTALMEEFARRLGAREPDLLVLRGRCHAAERLRYKVWDGIVDGLCRHLLSLHPNECRALLPTRADQLSLLFPVLGTVPALREPMPRTAAPDAVAERIQVFAAFGELLAALARGRPLLIYVDDLQWGDLDSLAILHVLCTLERSPNLLMLATVRPRHELDDELAVRIDALRAQHSRFEHVAVRPLSPLDALALSTCLLGLKEPNARAESIVQQTEGNPWLVTEMVRKSEIPLSNSGDAAADLAHALRSRVRRLGALSQQVMQLLCVAGGPQPTTVIRRVLELDPESLEQTLASLRAHKYIRPSSRDGWICYHDRIRTAVLERVSDEKARRLHAKLARVWQGLSAAPLRVASHLRAAGQDAEAVPWLDAADQEAELARAYDQAAELQQMALEQSRLCGAPAAEIRERRDRLAETLARAGRCAQSAEVLLSMVPELSGVEQGKLQVRAAERLLQAGSVAEGLAVARLAFATLGIAWPETTAGVLSRTVFHRAASLVRGLDLPERAREDTSREAELDAIWRLSAPLVWADLLRSAELTSRHLHLSLAAANRKHAARALLGEAFMAAVWACDHERSTALTLRAEPWVHELQSSSLDAYYDFVLGSCALFAGDLRRASTRLARASTSYESECADEAWLRTNARGTWLTTQWLLGKHADFCARVEAWIAEASLRQDAFAEATFAVTSLGALRHCAYDKPAQAHAELERVGRPWQTDAVGALQANEVLARYHIHRYEGKGTALTYWQAQAPRLKRSLIMRSQAFNDLFTVYHMDAKLEAAALSGEVDLNDARRSLTRIATGTRPSVARYLAMYFVAQLAVLDGRDDARAADQVRKARDKLEAKGLFYAAHARLLQAHLEGRQQALAVESELLAWYEAEGWTNPERALAGHLAIYPLLKGWRS